ncbi:MAG: PepSY-associated TM helix domain-containing protein [candidate division KSB1 bacterium]|jgi:hypothetical protein|nr:PepSY-associated TM helix domain-containing protein [candidate division KSB1 bacterium]
MRINWRKWNRVLHRDLGYFFFGMTVIYAISGIALNHIDHWNPSYIVTQKTVQWDVVSSDGEIDKAMILEFLDDQGEDDHYKKHYYPEPGRLKIFLDKGSVDVDLESGRAFIEKLQRRALFYQVNFLHYNPKRLWTWFSDIYCVALILVAITGLFILKGRHGITGRGAWLTAIGIIVPIVFFLMYQ